MEIQQHAAEWWAAADGSTQMAVIVFGSTLLLMLVFMIIGANINPLRRPRNEAGFREFARATLATTQPDLRASETKVEEQVEVQVEEPAQESAPFKARRF